MKINQYCSVCKKHLDMEVIPTDDGGDDGVIWLRCPECQGFLPKFTGEGMKTDPPAESTAPASPSSPPPESVAAPAPAPTSAPVAEAAAEPPLAEDVPDGHADQRRAPKDSDEAAAPEEPVAEYAALLAEADTTNARPYRPASSYEVGEVVLHLAYDDVGIVVAKEALPGGRKALKVFFDGAGVVHLIEQAADGH